MNLPFAFCLNDFLNVKECLKSNKKKTNGTFFAFSLSLTRVTDYLIKDNMLMILALLNAAHINPTL